VAVRIVEEQDPAYREALHTMHSTGVPTMGVFDGSGVLQRCIGGWKRPEEFVDELRAGLQGCGYLNR
jgi:hypothetical protein